MTSAFKTWMVLLSAATIACASTHDDFMGSGWGSPTGVAPKSLTIHYYVGPGNIDCFPAGPLTALTPPCLEVFTRTLTVDDAGTSWTVNATDPNFQAIAAIETNPSSHTFGFFGVDSNGTYVGVGGGGVPVVQGSFIGITFTAETICLSAHLGCALPPEAPLSHYSDNYFVLHSYVRGTGGLTIQTSQRLPSGTIGTQYSTTLTATGGTPPYMWSLPNSQLLPSGFQLDANSGVVSGSPQTAGTWQFQIQVNDNSSSLPKPFDIQTFTLTVTPAADSSLGRNGTLAHIVAGGSWDTAISLINTSLAAVSATLIFRADNGSALTLPITTTNQGSTQSVTSSSVSAIINPNSTLVITTGQLASTVVGWAEVDSSAPISGYAIFRTVSSNSPVSEGTVRLETTFPSTISLPYDNTAGFVMGVALANLSSSATNVAVTIWDDSGNQLGTQTISLAGNGHTSFVLPTQILLTAGKRGIVQFQTSGGIAGLGLRFSSYGTFTSVPVF